jgi:hypothetical protein
VNLRSCFRSLLLAATFLLPLTNAACDPALNFTVENQTDRKLTIYVDGSQYSDVASHTTAKVVAYGTIITSTFFVEALDEGGEIIFSKAFNWQYPILDEFPRDHKIVITPKEEKPYLQLEIVNQTKYQIMISIVTWIGHLEPGQSMKKRPLPSELDTYTVTAITYDVNRVNQVPNRTSAAVVIYKHQFTKADLEKENWHIAIVDAYSHSP